MITFWLAKVGSCVILAVSKNLLFTLCWLMSIMSMFIQSVSNNITVQICVLCLLKY